MRKYEIEQHADPIPHVLTRDGDPVARYLVNRHYSRNWRGKPDSKMFIGPGKKLVVRSPQPYGGWVITFRYAKHRADRLRGTEITVFRNESSWLSSSLIKLACSAWCREKFTPDLFFTFVHPELIRSTNPGACFKHAGFKTQKGYVSGRGLILLTAPGGIFDNCVIL